MPVRLNPTAATRTPSAAAPAAKLASLTGAQLDLPAALTAAAKGSTADKAQPVFVSGFKLTPAETSAAIATPKSLEKFAKAVLIHSAPGGLVPGKPQAETLSVKPISKDAIAADFAKTVKDYQSGEANLPRTSADNYPYTPPWKLKGNLDTLTRSLTSDPGAKFFKVAWDDTDSRASNAIMSVNSKTGRVSLIGIFSEN